MVEEIEEVSAKLDLVFLGNAEVLHHREVHVLLEWTAVDVAHARAAEAVREGISGEGNRWRIAEEVRINVVVYISLGIGPDVWAASGFVGAPGVQVARVASPGKAVTGLLPQTANGVPPVPPYAPPHKAIASRERLPTLQSQ